MPEILHEMPDVIRANGTVDRDGYTTVARACPSVRANPTIRRNLPPRGGWRSRHALAV